MYVSFLKHFFDPDGKCCCHISHVNYITLALYGCKHPVAKLMLIDGGITYSVARVLGMTRAGMTEVLGFKFQ